MPTRNVNLTEHFDRFIETGVTSGRFSNASEVVREGLRLLEQREEEDKAKLKWLRGAAKEGFDAIERGDYVAVDSEQELDAFLGKIRAEVTSELASESGVTKKRFLKIFITGPARRDIAAILKRSAQEFGIDASLRYQTLIRQALLDIEADHERPGSKARPELMVQGARTYHLSFSRTKVNGARVKELTHFLLYRRCGEVIEVARVLHDVRDLGRHLPEGYRRSE